MTSVPNLVAEDELNKIHAAWKLLRNTDMDLPADVSSEYFWKRVSQKNIFGFIGTLDGGE